MLPIIEFYEVHNTQNDKSSLYIYIYIYTCGTYKAWFWSEAAFTNMSKSVIFLRKKKIQNLKILEIIIGDNGFCFVAFVGIEYGL